MKALLRGLVVGAVLLAGQASAASIFTYFNGTAVGNGNQLKRYDAITGELLSSVAVQSNGQLAYGDGSIFTYFNGTAVGNGNQLKRYDAITGELLSSVTVQSNGQLAYGSIVPIPSTVWLLGSALGALMGWRNRQPIV